MKSIEQAKGIYQFCAVAANQGRTVSYREVLNHLGYKEKASGHVIRYGLELAWMACAYSQLPSLTAIVVNKISGAPSEGYSVENWKNDAQAVFEVEKWPDANSIDWDFIWEHRAALSEKYGTRGYWTRG